MYALQKVIQSWNSLPWTRYETNVLVQNILENQNEVVEV